MSADHKPFYILSIDGGGFRGLFSAHLLKRIEEEWDVNWITQFDMLAGTSTGAILAAGLACGQSAARLTEFYMTEGESIFTPKPWARLPVSRAFVSRYSIQKLKERLDQVFGSTTLEQITTPLILPAVDIGNGCVHVTKSRYHDGFVRDHHVRLSDAVLASCAAPTYFDPVLVDKKYQLVDGGLWANNPSLVAAIDANYRLDVPLERIRVLSVGTGKSKTFYPRSRGRWKDSLLWWQGWGLFTRWNSSRLIDLVFNLQSDNAHNMLCALLRQNPRIPTHVLRITFESDRPLALDGPESAADWIAKADHAFTHGSDQIAEFLSLGQHAVQC